MRISDWSSDVCSSDLDRVHYFRTAKRGIAGQICEAYDPAGSGVLIANDYSLTTSRSDFFCNGFAADSLPRERLVPPLVSDDAQYLEYSRRIAGRPPVYYFLHNFCSAISGHPLVRAFVGGKVLPSLRRRDEDGP